MKMTASGFKLAPRMHIMKKWPDSFVRKTQVVLIYLLLGERNRPERHLAYILIIQRHQLIQVNILKRARPANPQTPHTAEDGCKGSNQSSCAAPYFPTSILSLCQGNGKPVGNNYKSLETAMVEFFRSCHDFTLSLSTYYRPTKL